ncbi:MAG TPA: YfiR family protein [Rhizorhapis sp.]|nr:YfiR family protein [Rhizorhapis sp.]
MISSLLQSCIAMVLAVAAASPAAEAKQGPLDTDVKAAFLPKFAAYVSWPPGTFAAADDPIRICVIGRSSFGASLDEAAARERIDQHPVQVRKLAGTSEAAGCHIAFVGGSPKESPAAMLAAFQGRPVLTVTDDRIGADRGIVHFVVKDGRVRFHIDDALAGENRLDISARLLSLALSVKQRGRA